MWLYRYKQFYVSKYGTLEKRGAKNIASSLDFSDDELATAYKKYNDGAKIYWYWFTRYSFFLISIYLVIIQGASGPSILQPLIVNIQKFGLFYISGLAIACSLLGLWDSIHNTRGKLIEELIGDDEQRKLKWAMTHGSTLSSFEFLEKSTAKDVRLFVPSILVWVLNYLIMAAAPIAGACILLIYIPFYLIEFSVQNFDTELFTHWVVLIITIVGFCTPILEVILRYSPVILVDESKINALVGATEEEKENLRNALFELYKKPLHKKVKIGLPEE